MNRMIVAYATTRDKYYETSVAIKSLRYHNPEAAVIVFAEDDDIGIEGVNVIKLDRAEPYTDGVNSRNYYTFMSLIRLAFTKYLPGVDKILYLDIDTIVKGNLAELWSYPMDGCYVAAVKEPRLSAEIGKDYFNTGVLLMDLARLRDGTDDKLLDMIRTTPLRYPDQDCINKVCLGKIKELPSKYNASFVTGDTDEELITHFASIPYWRNEELFKEYENMEED